MGNHDDIQDLIYAAWKRIRPRLEDEPALLSQRLQRRRTPTLTRPPRAWCIALRASDHRLLSRIFPSQSPFGDPQFNPDDHALTITAPVLRSITAPIHLTAPGETLTDTARLLGTSAAGLLSIRLNQTVRTHHIPPTCYKGHPQPLLYIEHPLDPCAKGFRPQDSLWSWTSTFLATRIPKHFEQTLRRVALYRPHVPRHRYAEFAHPELDDAAPRKSKRLPAPLIEPTCWYKWSAAGYYLGNDPTNWRKSFQDPGNRPPRNLPRPGKAQRRPALSTSQGSLHFNGYQWLCPACGKSCRTIYLPVEPINLLKRSQPKLADVVDIPKTKINGTFACSKCHRLRFFTTLCKNTWNQLISYMTTGLLYGREVPRPDWFTPKRKNAFAPRPNMPPSKRRPQIIELVLKGLSRKEIAAELHIARWTVVQHLKVIFKQHRVRSRVELARKLERPIPESWLTKLETIRLHLAAGRSYDEIAEETTIPRRAIAHYVAVLRRKGVSIARHKKTAPKRNQIAKMLAEHRTVKEIAAALNLSTGCVRAHRSRLHRFTASPLPA